MVLKLCRLVWNCSQLRNPGKERYLYRSPITGDIGVSPIAATAMTGFSLTMGADTAFYSNQVLESAMGRHMVVQLRLNTIAAAMKSRTRTQRIDTRSHDVRGINFMGGALGGERLL
jgi:hypothetical protein